MLLLLTTDVYLDKTQKTQRLVAIQNLEHYLTQKLKSK